MTSKRDENDRAFAHLRDAAAALGLDPTAHDTIEWLIEVDLSEAESDVPPHIQAPTAIRYDEAKVACERALVTWMAQPMAAAEVHAHVGRYGGAGARDESKAHAAWKRDRRIAELAAAGEPASVIGKRMEGISADAVRKAVKRHQLFGAEREAELIASSPEQREMRARLLQRLRNKRLT